MERRILLAREDSFLLLTDSIVTPDNENGSTVSVADKKKKSGSPKKQPELIHTSSLPLSADLRWEPAEETQEGVLTTSNTKNSQPIARILPLALPEWRIDHSPGKLAVDQKEGQGALTWSRQTTGSNLASPLFVDLNRRRATKQCTWRQLTVAQSLVIQPPEVAVGYRIQCAKKQWLVYQSLGPKANRSLLGHNLSSGYLVGRFLPKLGQVDELLEVED